MPERQRRTRESGAVVLCARNVRAKQLQILWQQVLRAVDDAQVPGLQFKFRFAFAASESLYPNIFAHHENIGRLSWRRFFKVTGRDLDLLNSKQFMRGIFLRFSCAFRL